MAFLTFLHGLFLFNECSEPFVFTIACGYIHFQLDMELFEQVLLSRLNDLKLEILKS